MAAPKDIPCTNPIPTLEPHPQRKGLGVLGLHEGGTLLAAMDRCSAVHAVAGCDLDKSKRTEAAAKQPGLFYTEDYAAMLARPDVDIVGIYTPDKLHGEHIEMAFEAGKDVICTKPLVNSLDDARRILEVGRRTGRRLQVGQSTRFFEPFRRQRAAFERGEFGRAELVDAHYIHCMDWFYAKSPWALTETDWIFLGMSHPIDLLRWYLGPIKEVSAYGITSEMGDEAGLQGRDVYTVNVISEDGKLGRAMGHYGCHELPSARNCIELMIYGSNGSSLAQYQDMRYVHTASDNTEICEDHLYAGRQYYFNSEIHGMHYGEFANYAESFALALINGAGNAPDLEEGVETFCIMEAVRESTQTRNPVQVEPLLAAVGLR